MKYGISIFLFIAAVIYMPLHGQTKAFDGIKKVKLSNMGSIKSGDQVTGYYLFYKVDKVDRKNHAYKLQVLDQDLNIIKTQTITGSKALTLLEGRYNGNSLLMKFIDRKTKVLTYRMYNSQGEEAFVEEYKLEKRIYQQLMANQGEDGDIVSGGLSAVGNVGFIDILPLKNKKYTYALRYLSNDNSGSWYYESSLDRGAQWANFLYADENHIICRLVHKKKLLANKFALKTVVFDTKTGKQLQEILHGEEAENSFIIGGYADVNEDVHLIGTYFGKGDDPVKSQPLGLVKYDIQGDGSLGNQVKTKWNGPKAPRRKKGSKKKKGDKGKNGNVFFHKVVSTSEGKAFAIGEVFKKKADGAGIAISALGGSASVVKIKVYDMFVMEFNDQFDLNGVKYFEKKAHGVPLLPGSLYLSPSLLGHYIKMEGGFDYVFTQVDQSRDFFVVGFLNTDRKDYSFVTVTYADGVYTEDAISLNTDATDLRVLDGKPGHILISEYYKKDKRLNLRLEKANF